MRIASLFIGVFAVLLFSVAWSNDRKPIMDYPAHIDSEDGNFTISLTTEGDYLGYTLSDNRFEPSISTSGIFYFPFGPRYILVSNQGRAIFVERTLRDWRDGFLYQVVDFDVVRTYYVSDVLGFDPDLSRLKTTSTHGLWLQDVPVLSENGLLTLKIDGTEYIIDTNL